MENFSFCYSSNNAFLAVSSIDSDWMVWEKKKEHGEGEDKERRKEKEDNTWVLSEMKWKSCQAKININAN